MFFVINIPPNTLEILPFQSYSCNKALPCLLDLGKYIFMEIENNESTDLRPEGTRKMGTPLVNVNIPEFIKQLKAEVKWQTSD